MGFRPSFFIFSEGCRPSFSENLKFLRIPSPSLSLPTVPMGSWAPRKYRLSPGQRKGWDTSRVYVKAMPDKINDKMKDVDIPDYTSTPPKSHISKGEGGRAGRPSSDAPWGGGSTGLHAPQNFFHSYCQRHKMSTRKGRASWRDTSTLMTGSRFLNSPRYACLSPPY